MAENQKEGENGNVTLAPRERGATVRYVDLEDLRLKGKDVHLEKSKIYCSQFRKFLVAFEDEWFSSVTKVFKVMMYYDFTVGMSDDYSAVIQAREEGAFKPVKVPLLSVFGNTLEVPGERELKKRAREAAWRIFLYEGEPFPPEKELSEWDLKKYRRVIDPSKKVSLEKLLSDQEGRAREEAQKALKGLPPMVLSIDDDVNHYSTAFTVRVIAPIRGEATFSFIDRNGNKLLIPRDAEIRRRARAAFEEIFDKQDQREVNKEANAQ
jgi:hypothetical protein